MHIFIFHRDLRIVDNTSLINQIKEMGEVVPIFIFTPEQINPSKNDYFSNNSVQFMIESLHELSDEIKKKNGKIYFFKGDTIKVIKALNKKEELKSISYNLDYTPYARKRDDEIKKWCEKNNVSCFEKEDYVLYDILNGQTKKKDGTPYLVYTPFRNYCMSNLKVREVDGFKSFKFNKVKELEKIKYYIDEKEIDDFYEDNPNINVHGGRSNGLKILAKLDNFKSYQKDRDTLSYKTTFLGAHNHFSTVSIREVYYKMSDKLGKHSGLINEIHWRDFYINITYEFPHILKGQVSGINQSYKKEYDNIKWSHNTKWFNAWCEGTTGFPVIDAAMRQIKTIGFMHNRARMFTSSFLTKDMHIDWRDGEKYFASLLVDYDPISNNGGWQWSTGSGTDAQPYFRIFNPWSQQEKFDPDCEYIKKWLPELKDIPNKDLHKWFKPEIHQKWLDKGIKYFKPILDHDIERKETLKLYKSGLK
jgi:deoxyribodipyrimidine photo-lyase